MDSGCPGGGVAGSTRPGGERQLKRLLLRPELTAIVGTLLVFAFFAIDAGPAGFLTLEGTANYLNVAAYLGILAAPVTLLLIAGEFDLSVGASVGTTGIAGTYMIAFHGWPLWAGFAVALAIACLIGLVNGLIVVYSRIPSFLVTLAVMFGLQGVTLAFTKSATSQTAVSGVTDALKSDPLLGAFTGHVLGVPVSVFWWLVITVGCGYLLQQTRFGNWIFAAGGNWEAANRMGVPVRRVKILLFIGTAAAASLMALLSALEVNQAGVSRGSGMEFEAIVAAVIGGSLITGGYGSPLGTAFGALLFAMVSQGFFFTNIDDNYFQTFVGAMLLAAVGINQYTRAKSLKVRISQ